MHYSFPHKYLSVEVSEATLARKRKAGICRHHRCAKPVRDPSHTDCNTCASRKNRLAQPIRYAFAKVRRSAEMRGIEFSLTYEEFVQFDKATGYVARMGAGHDDLSIDRIDSGRGYEVGNIRAISFEDNIRKKLEKMVYPYDPIAKALQERSGGERNWRAFRHPAQEVYELVTRLQGYQTLAPEEPTDEDCPF